MAAFVFYGLISGNAIAQPKPTPSLSPAAPDEAVAGAAGSEPVPSATVKATPVPTQKSSSVPLTTEQIRSNLPTALADKVEFLRRQRKVTLEAIDEITSQLKALTSNRAAAQDRRLALETTSLDSVGPSTVTKERMDFELQRAKDDLAEAQQKFDAAKKNPSPNVDVAKLEFALRDKQSALISVQDAIARQEQRKTDDEKRSRDLDAEKRKQDTALAQLNEEIEKATQTQLVYQRTLREIDEIVNQMFIASDATNSFKLKMSIILSLLVAVVIGGFFWVAWSDEQVKRSIFSSESGIQFITLFAIVISVILFGIIGVLEGKELSALLGGLSGYILGRGNQQREARPPTDQQKTGTG